MSAVFATRFAAVSVVIAIPQFAVSGSPFDFTVLSAKVCEKKETGSAMRHLLKLIALASAMMTI
jgi:hypothetical protein